MSTSWEAECHVLYEDIKKQTQFIKEQQEEINRLSIAYQNASDQRQHYVEKCLKLSEGFLESHELLNNHNNFAKDILELEGANWTNIDAFFDKHKDLIEELKRNLEVKSE